MEATRREGPPLRGHGARPHRLRAPGGHAIRRSELRAVHPARRSSAVEDVLGQMLADFHAEHERAYGFAAPGEPVEFVTLRLTAVGKIAKPRLRELPARGGDADAARRAVRQVFFAESGGFVDCPMYDRYRLRGRRGHRRPVNRRGDGLHDGDSPGLSRRGGPVRQPARRSREAVLKRELRRNPVVTGCLGRPGSLEEDSRGRLCTVAICRPPPCSRDVLRSLNPASVTTESERNPE